MEKLQYDSSEYKLYAPDTLKIITDNMQDILLQKITEYKELFLIKDYRQIQINYFDDINKFREFVIEVAPINKETLPKYARGTYDGGMINAYIEPNIEFGTHKYKDNLYMASHELFHIMYLELILDNNINNRITWYDEGMAQLLSGEKDDLLKTETFKDYYLKVKENTKIIPNLNEISHGEDFCNSNYNGYDLSYLAVRYLKETLSKQEFKELLKNQKSILICGNCVLDDMFNYYDIKFKNKTK